MPRNSHIFPMTLTMSKVWYTVCSEQDLDYTVKQYPEGLFICCFFEESKMNTYS